MLTMNAHSGGYSRKMPGPLH